MNELKYNYIIEKMNEATRIASFPGLVTRLSYTQPIVLSRGALQLLHLATVMHYIAAMTSNKQLLGVGCSTEYFEYHYNGFYRPYPR